MSDKKATWAGLWHELQRAVSEAIATAIQGELLPEERESLMAYRDISDDMEANEATVHAAEYLAHAGKTEQALGLMEQLRTKAPDFLKAWEATERILAYDDRYDEIVTLRWERAETLSEDSGALQELQDDIAGEGASGYWEWKFEGTSAWPVSGIIRSSTPCGRSRDSAA
jgi:hypothetical protein